MRPSLIGVLVVLLAVAAGCGGSTPSASEQWADSFCGSVDGWATQIRGYASDVQTAVTSPSADSVTTIKSTIAKGADATNQMVSDVKALGPPPSESGQSASTTVSSFTTQVEQTLDEVQTQAQSIQNGSSASAIVTAAGTIGTEVSAAVAKGKMTVESLKNQSSELKDGFEKSDSCQQLQDDFG
jgi:hypothetical protein